MVRTELLSPGMVVRRPNGKDVGLPFEEHLQQPSHTVPTDWEELVQTYDDGQSLRRHSTNCPRSTFTACDASFVTVRTLAEVPMAGLSCSGAEPRQRSYFP